MAAGLAAEGFSVMVAAHRKGELFRRLKDGPVPVTPVRIGNLSFLNPWKVYRISRMLRASAVESIILNLPSDVKAAGVAARLAGIRNIIYRRGSAIPVRNTLLNRFLFKRVINMVIANSRETAATLLHNNPSLIPEEKIHIVYNGIDLAAFDCREYVSVYDRKGKEVVLGNAGRLVEQKGQDMLLEIASLLKQEGFAFRLLVAGTGPLETRLRQKAGEAGLEGQVIFTGFAGNIKSFLHSIDVFLLPSRWEGFGYVLLEAMACRKPIVCFDTSSNPELVEDSVNGFLVKPFDLQEFAGRIKYLALHPDLLEKMGAAGRKKAEEKFTLERAVGEMRRLLTKET
jgi:glycosyltransferase involved in cell wall biosynthesis